MDKVITYFLPKQIEGASKHIQNKARNLIFCLIGIASACLVSIALFTIYPQADLRLLTFLMLFASIGLLFFFKYVSQHLISTYLFGTLGAIYIAGMVYYTGGVNSSFIIWIITLPIVATLIATRVGLIYYATTLATIIYLLFGWLGTQGLVTPNLIPTELGTTYNIINQILIMLTVVAILIFYYYQNQSYNQQLKTSNEDLERFAYVASHDMKAPLRNIVSFSQLLKRKLKKSEDQDLLEYLGFIEDNGKQMTALIQGLLDYSIVEKQKTVDGAEVVMEEVLQKVINNIQSQIQARNGIVDFKNLPNVFANELQMVQLFQNLIENGLKYNKSKEPTVIIRCQEEAKYFEFFIEDNGIGINEEFHTKIFKMFKRLNSAAEYQGTGIGLATCKKIAQLHGGDLYVLKSSPTGTTFKFLLPLRKN